MTSRWGASVDEILARQPLRLPLQLGHSESYALCRNLGVRLHGHLAPRVSALADAELPQRWIVHRTETRWIEVRDETGAAVIEAFYKFTGHETPGQDAADGTRT
jgi:hypothetical protein